MQPIFRALLVTALMALVAGCSGGGSSPLGAPSPVQPGTRTSSAAIGNVSFSIAVPGRKASRLPHRKLPRYVSTSTKQVAIVVEGAAESSPEAPKTFACTTVCTGSFSAPAGPDRVTLTLEDSAGKPLSTGVTTVVVFSGQTDKLSFVLDGIATSVDVSVSTTSLPVVPATNGYIIFNARDADGNVITYDGHYADANDEPLTFDLKSSSAAFVLGITTVSAPGTLIPFTYDGKAHVGTITLTPSAHAGVTTTVRFSAAIIKLIPGIAQQIDPPLPLEVVAVQQFAFPTTAFDAGAQLIVGNGADGIKILRFNPTTNAYTVPKFAPLPGTAGVPFIGAPNSTRPGVLGYTAQGNSLFASYEELSNGTVGHGAAAASPCAGSTDTPLGPSPPSTVYCENSSLGSADFIYSGSFVELAAGTVRKITQFGSTVYAQTVDLNGVEVWTAGAALANTTNFGYDATNPSNFYFTKSDNTVGLAGSTTAVATFSHPPTMVVGNAPAVYVMEGQSFGYASGSTVSETGALPIGVPFELIVGQNGAPVIVEDNGRLDVMAI